MENILLLTSMSYNSCAKITTKVGMAKFWDNYFQNSRQKYKNATKYIGGTYVRR